MKYSIIVMMTLVMGLFLTGCIAITYEQKVDKNGDSVIEVNLNFEDIVSLLEKRNASNNTLFVEQNICENYSSMGWDCSYSEGELTLVKNIKLSEADFYTFDIEHGSFGETVYTLTVTKLPRVSKKAFNASDTFNYSKYENLSFTSPEMSLGASTLKLMNMNITYVVEMPAQIESANGAIAIEGNRATFNILEMMKNKQNIVVVAKESYMIYVMIGACIMVVFAVIVGILIYRKRMAR